MRCTPSRSTKHPVVKQIAAISNAWKSRTNIVSADLCDDVIQRLAPSLAQHIGGTIIDINPGVGLWSSKLHDYLKPRNHILMEPRQKVYLPFLQPLLDAPGSRYRLPLKDWPESQLWQPKRYVEEGLLHDVEGHGGPPPTTEEPNNSILIIANLAGQRHQATGDRYSKATMSAHLRAIDFSHTVRHRSGFQKYGPTRMLMWLSDRDKRPLLPRTVGYRAKISVYMEANFDLEEIVGSPDATIRREDALDIESAKQVAKRMQEKDMKIPLHRQAGLGDRTSDISDVSRDWHREMRELEEGLQKGKFSKHVETTTAESIDRQMPRARSGTASGRAPIYTPEYKRMRELRRIANSQNNSLDRINTVLKQQENIDKMDLDMHRDGITALEKEEIIKALDSRIQEFKDELETLRVKQLQTLEFLDDNRRAFAMDPPLLMWDRRKAEPLSAEKDDFYAPGDIALLDFRPKKSDEIPMTSEQSLYFDLIATGLFGPRGSATLKHLKTLAPGAFEALVPQVPSIRDPRKGGRYDMDSIRARVMTPKMIHGLAVAWDKWVFKPPIEDALTQYGSNFDAQVQSKKGAIARL